MKIYENETDRSILDYLNKNNIKRTHLEEKNLNRIKQIKLTRTYLNDVRTDPFYYWIHIYWDQKLDLKEVNPYFIPVISKNEYEILFSRYIKKSSHLYKNKEKKNIMR